MPGTTPVYGFPYPEPTDLVADYPALGQQLAEDIEATLPTIGGMLPVQPASIANSGGSASASANVVTFTGVTSVSLNGVWTSANANYRILFDVTKSAASSMNFRLRNAGTDATGAIYSWGGSYFYPTLGQAGAYYGNAQTSFAIATINTTRNAIAMDIYGPQTATNTNGHHVVSGKDNSALDQLVMGLSLITDTNSYDGFTLFAGSGTITGKVRVYAYKGA